jgi:hypothetical protein
MKRCFVLVILFVSLASFSQKQETKEVFGYSCSYSGSETEVVIRFAKFLYDKKYKAIREALFSKEPAENFIAVVICKRLEHKKLIKLTEKEIAKIAELYRSKKKVIVCGGCTYSGEIELTKMFNSKPEMFAAIDYYFHDEK